MAYIVHTIDMGPAGTRYTPWVDVRTALLVGLGTDCEDIASPVGVIALELSNDVAVIEGEIAAGGLAPAAGAAKSVVSSLVPTGGNTWLTGYDGVGSKVSVAVPAVTSAFIRVRYIRTSGGVGDTLTVRWVLTGTK